MADGLLVGFRVGLFVGLEVIGDNEGTSVGISVERGSVGLADGWSLDFVVFASAQSSSFPYISHNVVNLP